MDMQTAEPEPSGPVLDVRLALADWLQPLVAEDHPLHAFVWKSAVDRLNWLVRMLGIPGEVRLTLDTAADQAAWGKVFVQGQICRPSEYPAGWAARNLGQSGPVKAAGLQAWLADYISQPPDNAKALIGFLADACLRTVMEQPELFMGRDQAAWIRKELPEPPRRKGMALPAWPPDPDWLLPALRSMTGLGISVANRAAISQMAAEALLGEESIEDLGERLAGNLAPRTVTIVLPPARLQELTLEWQSGGANAFGDLRRRMAGALGFYLPPFQLEESAMLGEDEFAIRINDLPTIALGVASLLEVLEGELRRQFPRLVILPRVEALLDVLDDELQEMVTECLPLARLTRLLRALVTDQRGALRRLPLLLEHLLDYPFYQAGASGSLALLLRPLPPPPDTADEFAAQLAFLKNII
jgi:hypothetical protein